MKMKQYCALLLILICSISDLYTCYERKLHKKRKHNHSKKSKKTEIDKFSEDFDDQEKEMDSINMDQPSLFMELKKSKTTKSEKKPKKAKKAKKVKIIKADNPDMIMQPKEKLDIIISDYMKI
jgi:sortase (surface protein transpeptidase)